MSEKVGTFNLKHGDRISCYISTTYVPDAKIAIDQEGRVFVCQDKRDGAWTGDRLGYMYSWGVGSTSTLGRNLSGNPDGVTKVRKLTAKVLPKSERGRLARIQALETARDTLVAAMNEEIKALSVVRS